MSDTTRALLDRYWTVPGELVAAAGALWDPIGPDPERLAALAGTLRALSADASGAGLAGVSGLARALADLADGLARGALDPVGPAGAVLEPGAVALEDALVLLDAGQPLDEPGLALAADRARHALRTAPGGAHDEPAVVAAAAVEPPSTAAVTPVPWEPSYPDMVDEFLEEVQAHIDTLQAGLIKLSAGPCEPALINDLFRSSHSIKGQSGQMGAKPLERVAHKLEDVLDLVRRGQLALTPASTESLLHVIDALQAILEQLRTTRSVAWPLERELELMERVSKGEAAPPAASPAAAPATSAPRPAAAPAASGAGAKTAAEPEAGQAKAQFLRVDFAKVDQVMNLVGDLFTNKIKLHDGVDALSELHLQVARLQTLVARHVEEGGDGLALDEEEARRLLGGVASVASGLELLTDRLTAATGETTSISSDLRDQVMLMRMVPLDSVFRRLERVVFDAVQKEGRGQAPGYKQARLEIEGADAEIDKVIANMLEVPLVHIVRNAVAHGIEPATDRVAAGKPAEGAVRLRAGQRGSQFVIQVRDDGRGMRPAFIGETAIAKGLVGAEELAAMSDTEVLGLIFKPGFTTADKADDLKGRGVGLDEVMSKVSQVKGSVEVASEVGRGTTVTLSLPLTLAINTVILGEVAGEILALPMSVVERVVMLREREVERLGDAEVFTLLEQTVPLVRADSLLGMGRKSAERPDTGFAVVLNLGERRFGLGFDRMRGKQDVVVKSLGSLIRVAPLVAGSTLLGDHCVLILDPVEIAASLGKAQGAGPRRAEARGDRLRPRLLLVDDEAPTRLRLRRIFEEAGLDVQEAGDGAEALALATAGRFQLVSTDIVMPKMDGYELTRRLRALAEYRDVPIIMISSKSEEVDRRAGFEAGVDYYLVKPVERSALLELIDEVRL